uniref:aspartyl-phosphate phosphatase Spo0E family protein n=1 Tax=Alicyclobacillus tolerans TaxID=90970 RepID=UPI0023510777
MQTNRIESLRKEMFEVAKECQGNLLHPRVLKASEQLDREIATQAKQQLRLRRQSIHKTPP